MQVNCIIFPSPKEFKFGPTIKKILLVPRQKQQKFTYYHSQFLDLADESITDFELFTHNDQNKSMSKSTAQTKVEEKSQANITNENGEEHMMMKGENNKMKNQKTAIKHLLKSNQSVVTQESLPKVDSKEYIPCLFLPASNKNKVIVFFHANGEDISSAFQFIKTISNEVNVSILAMEYQGYSIYSGSPSPNTILQDANRVMQFLIQQGVQAKDIILVGRSIGGAMAFSIGALYPAASIILLSPFLSLKKIASDLYGTCSSTLLKETLDNQFVAKNIKSPILLIHGLKDQLVPYEHSVGILGECKAYCRLHLVQNMTHSKFSFRRDFTIPCKNFLQDIGVIN